MLNPICRHSKLLSKHFFVLKCSANVNKASGKVKIDILKPVDIQTNDKKTSNTSFDEKQNNLFSHDFINFELAEFNMGSNFALNANHGFIT